MCIRDRENQRLKAEVHQWDLDLAAARHAMQDLEGQHSMSSSQHSESKIVTDQLSSQCSALVSATSAALLERNQLRDRLALLVQEKDRVSSSLHEVQSECLVLADATQAQQHCIEQLAAEFNKVPQERLLRRDQMLRHVCSTVTIILRERRMVAFTTMFFHWKAWTKEGALLSGAQELKDIVSASNTPISSPGLSYTMSEFDGDLHESFTSAFDVKAYANSLGF
eukprot:TRINITY_DN21732_c0_g1_i1.p1 TRINITY_DN21732_c0_g1~~TRINITY_DN21732_c0_g1_i1.p1  ORF type:complete len:224 (-),score=63.93 TRINITY_DN21732_c0_g1_i1:33-704(-)